MAAKKAAKKTAAAPQASKDEQIGYHKGCLTTLLKEREEFGRILNIVEQLSQMHMNALQELGVNLQQEGLTQQKPTVTMPKRKLPIDEIL